MSDTREWFSAIELAGLPGLPDTSRSVRRIAMRESWTTKKSISLSGQPCLMYHISNLPKTSKSALLSMHSAGLAPADNVAKIDIAQSNARLAGLPESAQQRIDNKIALINAAQQFAKERQLSCTHADPLFVADYAAGKITIAAEVRSEYPSVSVRSLNRWREIISSKGIAFLAGDYFGIGKREPRQSKSLIDQHADLSALIKKVLIQIPHARATQIHEALKPYCNNKSLPLPSLKTIERWTNKFREKNTMLLMSISDPDGYKSKFQPAFGSRSEHVERLDQEWQMDASPADVMCTDGRFHIIGCIDVWSRRLKFLVTASPTAQAVAECLRKCILAWDNVPETAKTDNGTDYRSKHMKRVFLSLAIEQVLCDAYSGDQKPFIERVFGTFTRGHVEWLPGFIGHSVADRKKIEARKSLAQRRADPDNVIPVSMTSDDLQKYCDHWTDNVYQHKVHSDLSITPFQKAAQSHDQKRSITDVRVLDILLSPAPGGDGWRVVTKKGIELEKAHFTAPELEKYFGQRVQVLLLPNHGQVVVNGTDPDTDHFGFICIAQCDERLGISRLETAVKAKTMRNERMKAAKQNIKDATKHINIEEVLGEMYRDSAANAKTVVEFPKPSAPHESSGVNAANSAVAALNASPRDTFELIAAAQHRALVAQIEAEDITAGNSNPFGARRLQNALDSGDAFAPVFNTRFERTRWTLTQARHRPLTLEERDFLVTFKKENRSQYESAREFVDEQFGAVAEDPANPG